MQRRSGEKTSHIETIITNGIKFSPLQAGSQIGLVLGISIYIHATVRSFGPLLDTSAVRGKNMKLLTTIREHPPPQEMPDLSIRS